MPELRSLLGPSIWAFLQDRAPPICWPSLLSFLQEPMSGDELMAPSSPGGSFPGSPLFSPIANDEEMELSLDEAYPDEEMELSLDEAHSVPADLVMSGTSSASCELSSGSAAVSAESPMISDDDAQAGLVGARGWQPGTNCGGFISWSEPLREQSQVLIANVYANMRRLPSAVARSLLCHIIIILAGTFTLRNISQIGALQAFWVSP